MALLGVNIDHIATLRQARREFDPDPIKAALICKKAGADSIVAHLREDRRHIIDEDIIRLKSALKVRFNLEMSIAKEIVEIASKVKPDQATLVPEKRQEITTEGGLDVVKNFTKIKEVNKILSGNGIGVSLFIDPIKEQIDKTLEAGVKIIEIHTGCYALAKTKAGIERQVKVIKDLTKYAQSLGLTVNAGHGLKYNNTKTIARIPGMHELNIGHSIIAHAVFVGLERAVKEMAKIVHGK
ncbi:MAG: pyridoxine 5'-phosphate synthase [Omnitrophica WOR_2 bacterium GWF2_38_59]|nr:MAG: pyridoxine 5'-phosphate synthase [Omnitrophica WOR_2 bacterium GWF2_38_59]OGX48887.1 MAG: pyridoxine 5'-phosphate synthase [Omnitrophica WOR_2 bacterium RIFOXYA2_FULL_38_17]OGX52559.1 MAG: pyridoxine 5'-phosphate synthase [Omnitrophica WOR_2 bacterium RIFOXYA12_FULL_38_10]OGX56861.1 MAG: pyridoxine 5'-phosphate synthase [Omnitrophica WOR_2 bacterium RIFOXYB2_FULL_38_16]OGX57616.1 MAG: pyridoxine 5'-phosphate synthase [Omnitrophica WOR_2 bacterium RIFOXYC2_FULL_38_12]HBG60792.1 pyridoxi